MKKNITLIPEYYVSLILFVLGFGIFLFTRMSLLVPTIPVAILICPYSRLIVLSPNNLERNTCKYNRGGI